MKKRIAFVLCIVMVLSMVLAGCSKTYSVETDLTELKLQGETEVKGGEDFEATLTPKGDFLLPDEITVKIDGSKLSAKKYTYDAETGEIVIPADEITGDIEIIADGKELVLTGEWIGTIDMTEMFNEAVAGGDPTMEEFFDFQGICFDLRMEFTEDGVCTLSVDSASVDKMVTSMKTQLTTFLGDYLQSMIDAEGYGMTVEELLGMQGYTLETFVDESFDVEDIASSFTDIYETGNYVAEDGMLYISDSLTADAMTVTPNPYTLDGDTLIIEATGEESSAEEFMYPLVMKRVG